MIITILQLSQMVIGVIVNLYALYMKSNGVDCLVETRHINLALIMYASYFLLFMNFFYAAYVKSQQKKAEAAKANGYATHPSSVLKKVN